MSRPCTRKETLLRSTDKWNVDGRVKYYTDVQFTEGDNCTVVIEENIFMLGKYLGLRIKGHGIRMTLKK